MSTRTSRSAARPPRSGERRRACARLPVVSKYIDTTTCIGCKACEVACQEWNDLQVVPTQQTGSYQTLPTLDAEFWNLIRFNERETSTAASRGSCARTSACTARIPGCLAACPAPGAIVQYENGIVDVNPEQCIGCQLLRDGLPLRRAALPRRRPGRWPSARSAWTGCTSGLEPACVKACPTGCLHFGTKDDMVALGQARVEQLKANGFAQAALYDPPGVGGTGVVTVLAHGDHPEWYDLPRDPHVPLAVRLWKGVLRPFGMLAIFGGDPGGLRALHDLRTEAARDRRGGCVRAGSRRCR